MKDFQFAARPFVPRRALIYIYDTGILKKYLFDLLRRIAIADDRDFFTSDPTSVLKPNLLEGRSFCAWPDTKTSVDSIVLRGLASTADWKCTVFLSRRSALLKNAEWQRCANTCLLLEETPVQRADLGAALPFLHTYSGIAPALNVRDPEFTAYYESLTDDGPIGWPELIAEFERDLLVSYDPATNVVVRAAGTKKTSRAERILLVAALKAFLESPDDVQRHQQLLKTVERRSLSNNRPDETIGELYKALGRVIDSCARKRLDAICTRAVEFLLLLMSREDVLGSVGVSSSGAPLPSQFIVTIDGAIRVFLASRLWENAEHNLWPSMTQIAKKVRLGGDSALAASRKDACEIILQSVPTTSIAEVPRYKKLLHEISAALRDDNATIDGQDGQLHGEDLSYQRWSEVPGEGPSPALLSAVRNKALPHPLLLWGFPRAGKKAVARLIAKSLLCLADQPDPCGECTACRSFDSSGTGGGFGYLEFAAGTPLEIAGAGALIESSGRLPFERNMIVVVDRAEHLSATTSDMLLSVFERSQSHINLLLLAEDPLCVRAALASRCHKYAVHRLHESAARNWTDHCSSARSWPIDASLRQFIAAASVGSPALIHQIVETLASKNITDVTVARQALDLCWPDRIIRFWMDALDAVAGEPPESNSNDNARATRLVSHLVALAAFGEKIALAGQDPALSAMKQDQALRLLEKLGSSPHGRPRFLAQAASLCLGGSVTELRDIVEWIKTPGRC